MVISVRLYLKRCNDAIPARLIVAIMTFFATLCLYMSRVNLSVSIIAMVTKNATEDEDLGPRYDWDEQVQGDVLAAFSYGYFITQFPGGMISEILGARIFVFVCMLVMGCFTIVTPFAAMCHWGVVMAVRIIIGLAGGGIYPALHSAISRWAPPQEKSKFVWSLLGGTFGTMVTFPLIGVLVTELGWPASFYISGCLAIFFGLLWVILIHDSPSKHPRITEEERTYIEEAIGANVSSVIGKARKNVPLLKVFTSPPFLALLVCHYGNLWGLFFLLTLSPKFMSDILGFNLNASGGLSSLPHLARLGFGLIFSFIGDLLVKKEALSRTMIRKIFILFSHLLPGALLFSIGYLGGNVTLIIVAMTMSLGFNGAAAVTNLANHHDLAPNYAGSLYGIMNGIGTTSGFIIPVISGRILEYNNTINEWRIIFIIGAAAYLIAGIAFLIFGSGMMQPWNLPPEREEEIQPEEEVKGEEKSEVTKV